MLLVVTRSVIAVATNPKLGFRHILSKQLLAISTFSFLNANITNQHCKRHYPFHDPSSFYNSPLRFPTSPVPPSHLGISKWYKGELLSTLSYYESFLGFWTKTKVNKSISLSYTHSPQKTSLIKSMHACKLLGD